MQAEEEYEQQQARVLCGDCLDILRTLPDASIEAMIADPPAGISFMSKSWDSDKGGRDAWIAWLADVMREALRVLKPGAHALVWSLPRTSHWTATALENAGFEIRDSIEHVFGSGFPKSHDVSKAIDRIAGAEREVIGPRIRLGDKKPYPYTESDYDTMGHNYANRPGITAPATLEAQHYVGFGTALKPAHETWWLVRAPLAEATVAANVLRYGTGGLNIDAARIATSEIKGREKFLNGGIRASEGRNSIRHVESGTSNIQGRFPSNFLLSHSLFCTEDQCADGCPIRELDQQSGTLKSGAIRIEHGQRVYSTGVYGSGRPGGKIPRESSEGGASRYFATFHYCSKASKRDRTADGTVENNHPTAKNTALLAYFARLITPPGGLVLDPFMGSGSTGVACLQEGMRFLGIEESVEYCMIARARLAYAQK
jgi:hypothetical protein